MTVRQLTRGDVAAEVSDVTALITACYCWLMPHCCCICCCLHCCLLSRVDCFLLHSPTPATTQQAGAIASSTDSISWFGIVRFFSSLFISLLYRVHQLCFVHFYLPFAACRRQSTPAASLWRYLQFECHLLICQTIRRANKHIHANTYTQTRTQTIYKPTILYVR